MVVFVRFQVHFTMPCLEQRLRLLRDSRIQWQLGYVPLSADAALAGDYKDLVFEMILMRLFMFKVFIIQAVQLLSIFMDMTQEKLVIQ